MAYRKKFLLLSMKYPLFIFALLLLGVSIFNSEQAESASTSPLMGEEALLDAVRKAQAGDKEAFNRLYQWYYRQIYKHLFRMVGNLEDASDLTAETFLKAWCSLSSLHDVLRFRSWLFSIATHRALDFLRLRRKHLSSSECFNEDFIDETAETLESSVEQKELVGLALMRIAPKPRACLLLKIEGFSHTEISNLVGLGTKSVGTYVSIAREQFRQAYYQLQSSIKTQGVTAEE